MSQVLNVVAFTFDFAGPLARKRAKFEILAQGLFEIADLRLRPHYVLFKLC